MTIADILTLTRTLSDTDSTSYTNANFLISCNQAYEEVVSWILNADGYWQFDDNNNTDFPIGSTTLVNNQRDYTFNSTMLEIERVGVLASDGLEYFLKPLDRSELDEAPETIWNVSGSPEFYDKQGSSIVLYPAPATGYVTLTNGLKVYFKRTASVFTSAEVSTGTKQPGFASPFHHVLAYMAAIPYCITYKKDRIPYLQAKVNEMRKEIETFYGHREQDMKKVITNKSISFR